MKAYLLVNFGGPRTTEEIPSFLTELLCDRDLIRTRFPLFLHNWLFRRVAKKRALKVAEDYEKIGGGSPIYADTEALREALRQYLSGPILTFHRYLPETHAAALQQIENCPADEILAFPLFPQFCYATTGSIARLFQTRLSKAALNKIRWIQSYPAHPAFISSYQRRIAEFMQSRGLKEEECVLLFSAHGVPVEFIKAGDPYESECQHSYCACLQGFPQALGCLAYQSKFGKGEWLQPATDALCASVREWHQGRKSVVFVPITFTSDHIETLFEVEKLYLPLIQKAGLNAYRCPALNLEPYWVEAIATILQESPVCSNARLIRI